MTFIDKCSDPDLISSLVMSLLRTSASLPIYCTASHALNVTTVLVNTPTHTQHNSTVGKPVFRATLLLVLGNVLCFSKSSITRESKNRWHYFRTTSSPAEVLDCCCVENVFMRDCFIPEIVTLHQCCWHRHFGISGSSNRCVGNFPGLFPSCRGCSVGNLGFLHEHCSRLYLMQASIPLFQLIKRRITFLYFSCLYLHIITKNQFTWNIHLRT